MKTRDTRATELPASDTGITVHNHLYPGHRYQAAMDEVFRVALRDLPGPWDVSVTATGRAWFRVEVIAPDGASWSMAVPVNEGPRNEDLAEAVRVACIRHSRRLWPATPELEAGKAGSPTDGAGGAGSKAIQPPVDAAHPPSHDAARGTPK
jgi:hypothetical protein